MMIERRMTRKYCVAGHLFGLTAGVEDVRLMDNYEPFSATSDAGQPKIFTLDIAPGTAPAYTEELRQDDGEQVIICGKTSGSSPVFAFQWHGVTAGWLVSCDDYKVARLITTGRLTKFAIDNALMIMYALSTAEKNTLLFHAAVVSHRGKGYMFLGPSGTGKSTHARLWLRNIKGAELVNDDNPVVRIGDDGIAMVFGSPWSGKTPCYRNVGYPIGGIVQLSQAPRNEIGRLSAIRAYAAIMQSVSGKRWERRIADGVHSTQSRLTASVAVWHMQCLPDKEAAEICETAVTEKA